MHAGKTMTETRTGSTSKTDAASSRKDPMRIYSSEYVLRIIVYTRCCTNEASVVVGFRFSSELCSPGLYIRVTVDSDNKISLADMI